MAVCIQYLNLNYYFKLYRGIFTKCFQFSVAIKQCIMFLNNCNNRNDNNRNNNEGNWI